MDGEVYRVIVPYYKGGDPLRLRTLSYPGRGCPLYTRKEAIAILKRFHDRRQTKPYEPLDCYAEGPHERFVFSDVEQESV